MKILIVDDDKISRWLIRRALEKDKFDLLEAENGNDALKILETGETVDLIISDIMMPDMDGLELIRHLKENKRTKHIKVIMISADREKETVMQAAALGIKDYIIKPIDLKLVRKKVQKIIEESQKILDDKYIIFRRLDTNIIEYKKMLLSFLDDAQGSIDRVHDWIEKGDALQVQISSNAIKGSAESMGTCKVEEAAQRLEEMGKEGDLGNADKALTMLRKEFERLREFALRLEENW